MWAFVVSGLAIASVPARGEEPQPKGGRPPASQPAAVRTYGKVRVLCVGIREFPHPLATLECAENDARMLAEVFTNEYGYEVIPPLLGKDATLRNIERTLRSVEAESTEQDVLIFFFSGHGLSVDAGKGARKGFLVPYIGGNPHLDGKPVGDAFIGVPSWSDKHCRAVCTDYLLSMNELSGRLIDVTAMHVILILDCCHAGMAADATRGGLLTCEEADSYFCQSRCLLAASGRTQSSWCGANRRSYFAEALAETLKERDAIPMRSLHARVSERVAAISRATQTDQRPMLRDMKPSDEGEFVFCKKGVADMGLAVASAGPLPRYLVDPEASHDDFKMVSMGAAESAKPTDTAALTDSQPTTSAPAVTKQEQEEAIVRLEQRASAGDPVAMSSLSQVYADGLGVEPDHKLAYWWAVQAKSSGSASGLKAMQLCYQNGIGVKKNPQVANEFASDAAVRAKMTTEIDRQTMGLLSAISGFGKTGPSGGHTSPYQGANEGPGIVEKLMNREHSLQGDLQDLQHAETDLFAAIARADRDEAAEKVEDLWTALDTLRTRQASRIAEEQTDEFTAWIEDLETQLEIIGAKAGQRKMAAAKRELEKFKRIRKRSNFKECKTPA